MTATFTLVELAQVVRARRMTRSFAPTPVGQARLETIFSDALRAPSAGFAQGVEFLVLTDPGRRSRFWELVSEPGWQERSTVAAGLLRAPVIALCLVDAGSYDTRYRAQDKVGSALGGGEPDRWAVSYPIVDAGFATMIVLLGVEAAGLGALFFHLQGRERAVLDGLGVPGRFETIGAVAIGERSDETVSASPDRIARRTDHDRVHYESFPDQL